MAVAVPVEMLIERLKKSISPELFDHCAGVADTAAELASKIGCNRKKAYLAGWLHDCARELSPEEQLHLASAHSIEVDRFSGRQPFLLHAQLGAVIASQWGCNDEDVLDAIRHHTLGIPGMTLLDKIIYVADKIEPGRNYPGVNELRLLVEADFHAGLVEVVAQAIKNVLQKKQAVHPLTVAFWNWLTDTPS